MGEIFSPLVSDGPAEALPHRAFDDDPRHRSTFIFDFEYFTLIGENCRPMPWQRADILKGSTTHFPLSRFSAVVALSLEGETTIGKVQRRGRRPETKVGEVSVLFSPWRVLTTQAYPDLESTVDVHNSTKHYLNGPEAFLITLRGEFRDAYKRLMDVHDKISDLVKPPAGFIFRLDSRGRLLFEDQNYTCSRRYFWAWQAASYHESGYSGNDASFSQYFH